jgi:hypothetical protein
MKVHQARILAFSTVFLFSLVAMFHHTERTERTIEKTSAATPATPPLPIAYGKEFWRSAQTVSITKPNPKFAALPFDPNDAVERASHAWAADLSVESRRYSARVSENKLELKTIQANGDSASATFSTRNRAPASAPKSFGNVVETKLAGGLTEHFEARRQGVFATWILNQRPQQNEPFTIQAELAGLDYKGQTERGHYFANAAGAGFLIGNATAVDSSGKSWPLAMAHHANGALQISVPENILDAAVYPLAIDPLISPEIGVDAPVDALAIDHQTSPSVAFNGNVYVATWSSYNNRTAEYSVRWAVFDSDGRRGPSQTVPISNLQPTAPQVASNGKEFLLVYQTLVLTTGGSESYGVFLDAMGNLKPNSTIGPVSLGPLSKLASNGTNYLVVSSFLNGKFTIATPAGFGLVKDLDMDSSPSQLASNVQVASDRTNYLAVWQVPVNGGTVLKAARISSEGEILQAAFPVGPATPGVNAPALAFNGGSYLLAYRSSPSFATVFAARLDTAGAQVGPNITIIDSADQTFLIGPHGDGFLATYFQYEADFSSISVRAARISASGVVSPFTTVSKDVGFGSQEIALNALGAESFVVWGEYHPESGFDLQGKLISAGSPGPLQIVSEGDNVETSPAVAYGSDGYLVVWQDNRWAITNHDDIFGIYLDQNGVAKTARAFPIATGVTDQSSPEVAANLGHYLVVWREETNGMSSDDVKGALLVNSTVAKSISICTETNAQRAVSVAGNGKDFLVVWRDNRINSQDDIYGAHVTFDGDVSGPQNGFPICTELYNQQAPVVASNGTNYLVAWRDSRNVATEAGDDIYGAIIEPLSSAPPATFAICGASGFQRAPEVASNGADYYAVWRDDRNVNVASLIYGTPVSHTGVVLAPAGIGVAIIPGAEQREPAIARLGSGYLVAWLQNNGDNPAIYKVYSRRIAGDGAALAGGSAVSNGSHDGETLVMGGGSTVDRAMILSQTAPDAAARVLSTQVCLTNCPIFVTIIMDNGTPAALWNAEANSHYRLESKDSLDAPTWQLVQEFTTTDEGFISAPHLTALGVSTRFYRAVRLP